MNNAATYTRILLVIAFILGLTIQPGYASGEAPADLSARIQERNIQSAALMAALQQGHFEILEKVLAADRREEGAEDIERLIKLFSNHYGAMTGFAVQGTVPVTSTHMHTYVEARFDQEVTTFRLTWDDDDLFGFTRSKPFSLTMVLGPEVPEVVSQEAINTLSGSSQKESRGYAARNQQTEQLLRALQGGDFAALEESLVASRREEGFNDFKGLFQVYQEAYGPISSFEVQGTLPIDGKNTFTYVQIRRGSHQTALRFAWLDDELFALRQHDPLTLKTLQMYQGL